MIAAFHNFLVFHVLAELFACVVGIVLFVVVVSTRRLTRNAFLLWIGCGYFWAAMVDLIHTLAYKGMHVFPGDEANLPTQLWIAGRAVQTVTLLLAPLFLSRPLSAPTAFGALGALAVGQGLLIVAGLYPDAFIEGMGLTAFKVGAEYVMVVLLAVAALLLHQRRSLLDDAVRRLVTASIVVTAASELSFTLYVDVYGVSNAFGHILKFVAFWLIYLAIIRTTLTEPFRVLARAASTYDAVPDATVLVGPDARIVQANRATIEEFRKPASQLIGMPVHELLHPWGPDAASCPDCVALAAGTPLPQREVFNPLTGHTYLVTFTPMTVGAGSGDPAGTIVVMRDITARRRAEDWVRTHAERLAMALDNGELGLWDWNVQTGTVYFSPNMELMLGYPAGSWERNVSAWETLVHPDDRQRVMTTLTAHLEGLTPIYECEHRLRRADGSWAWILDKGKVVERDDAGQPVRAVGTHTDISILKRQQEDLRDKSRRLEESNRDLEQFAYVASHDLQEPLRMVAGYLSLVRRRYADRLDGDGQEFISLAVDGAARMSRLISDLLEYSRVSTRAQEMRAVPAAAAVARAVDSLGAAIAEAAAEVVIAERLPVVQADPAQLERLFQNLIGNAVKYRAADRHPVIQVSEEPDAPPGFAAFAVSDNGIGIAPADHDRIFQIFTRLHGRAEYEGTGIGLAVCKRIVDRHGGTIAVRSAEGSGATFVFTLPLAEPVAAADTLPAAPAIPAPAEPPLLPMAPAAGSATA
ncbi:MASE3 domain-containing protein [Caenispirillum bisanense]|uniref:MASE3 domain-containing protein n=1 Tax=Caenispirillum bisanense TaxID=414052 RepID=UPI0031E2FCC9